MENQSDGLEQSSEVDIQVESFRVALKKVSKGKMVGYDSRYGFWYKKSRLCKTDLLFNWEGPLKKQIYPNWWRRGRLSWDCFPKNRKMPQGNKWISWFTVHWSGHPDGEQSEAEKCFQAVDWQQKELLYSLAMLGSENEQDIKQSHKINHGNHEKLESGIDSRKKKLLQRCQSREASCKDMRFCHCY